MNNKKEKNLTLIGIIVLCIALIGGTFAFFRAQGGLLTAKDVSVTSNTTDNLSFQISNDISFHVTQADLAQGGNNKSGSTTATAILTPNNKTGAATANYYMYLNLTTNEIVYSATNTNNDAELILQVFDSNNELVTLRGFGSQVTSHNGVTGYDITGKTGLKALLNPQTITASNSTAATDTWRVVITMINLNVDQNDNTGKTVEATIFMTKEPEVIIPEANPTSCFEFNELEDHTLEVTAYHLENNECSSDVVIPAQVDASLVSGLSSNNIEDNINHLFGELDANVVRLTGENMKTVSRIGHEAFDYVYNEHNDDNLNEYYNSVSARYCHNCKVTSVYLPNTITEIGYDAFYNNLIQELIIPSSVVTIGDSAFEYNSIEEVEIPISVEDVYDYAFSNNDLTSVTFHRLYDLNAYDGDCNFTRKEIDELTGEIVPLSNGTYEDIQMIFSDVTTISSDYYAGCISDLVLPDIVTIEDSENQYNTNMIHSVTLGNNLEYIGDYAFFGSSNIQTINLPNSVITIGDYAFYDMNNSDEQHLASSNLVIPNSVTTIGDHAFEGAYINNLTLSNSLTSIGDYAFSGTGATVNNMVLPNSLTSIGEYAFAGMTINNLTLPNNITTIGDYAFENSFVGTSLTIPNSVTSIGEGAFSGAYNLTSLTLSNSLVTIGDYAFYGFNDYADPSINLVIPNGVTTIGDYAFNTRRYSGEGGTYNIPNSVTSIGSDAFDSQEILIFNKPCSQIESMTNYPFSVYDGSITGTDGECEIN